MTFHRSFSSSILATTGLLALASPFVSLSMVRAATPLPPDTTAYGTLNAVSTPPDADVYLDNTMSGRTPLRLTAIAPGIHFLRIAKAGFCDYVDSIRFQAHDTVVKDVQLDSSCGLRVDSAPDGAAIYIDNVYYGKSPARIANLKPGWKDIKVTRRDYAIWQDHVQLSAGNTATVFAAMKSKFAVLDFQSFEPDVEVFLDGTRIGEGSVTDYMIPSGMHELVAAKSNGADTARDRFFVNPGERTRWEAHFRVPSRRAFYYSMLLPGLGQMMDGSTNEGFYLMSGFGAAAIFSTVMVLGYGDNVSDFDAAKADYPKARTEDAAKIAGDALSSKYEKVKKSWRLFSIGLGAAAAVYVYSLVDAFFNHSIVNEITPISFRLTNDEVSPSWASSPCCQLTLTFSF